MSETFIDTLGQLGRGDIASDLTEHLSRVCAAVVATDKKGSVVLMIEAAPNGDGAVQLTAKIKSTAPDPERGTTIMYISDDGGLSRRDPRQGMLDLGRSPGIREVIRKP